MIFTSKYLVFFTVFNIHVIISTSDPLKKVTSSLRGGDQLHYHDTDYGTGSQLFHSLRELQGKQLEACPLPINTNQFSLITKGDAEVAAHGIYKGMAIGGELYDPYPTNSKTVDGTAYVGSLSQQSGYNFNKGIEKDVNLTDVIDFAYFEFLAQNAQNWYDDDYKVVVLNEGGTYNTYDFRNGGQGEDNGKTLVIFNTDENVKLTQTYDGRQFGPSVIAPFSTVHLKGKAGFVDGFVVAKEFRTTGGRDKATQLQMHGDTYRGPIKCNSPPTSSPTNPPTNFPTPTPTNLPTSSPTSSPTNMHTPNPTNQHTYSPTDPPTKLPTSTPTIPPTKSYISPSMPPTDTPTKKNTYDYIPGAAKGGARGDPHFITWSGERYDFHGVCDLVLLHNPEFENSLGMYIHIRTKKTRQWSQVSAAVVKIGSDSLEISGAREHNMHWINKVQGKEQIPRIFVDPTSGATLLPATLSGYAITFQQLCDKQRQYVVDLRDNSSDEKKGDGEKIVLKTWHGMIRLDVIGHSIKNFGSSLGLMGSFGKGVKLARDGRSVINNTNDFGQEWQVLPSESKLFHAVDGPQAPAKCDVPSSTGLRRSLAESEVSRESAETACAKVKKDDFDMCIFDVMVTSDLNIAGAY